MGPFGILTKNMKLPCAKNFQLKFIIALFFLLFNLMISCETTKKKIKKKIIVEEKDNSRFDYLESIAKNYPFYKYFSASFEIRGRIQTGEIYQAGSIKVTKMKKSGPDKNTQLKIILNDAYFGSMISKLIIKNNYVHSINYLTNKKKKIKLEDFRWVEVFGRVFPFSFFLPILMGFPPDEIYFSEAKVSPGKKKIVYKSPEFDIITKFTSKDFMKTLLFRSRFEKAILIIHFLGRSKTRRKFKRYFPKELHITQSKDTNDYISMKFKNVKFTEHKK